MILHSLQVTQVARFLHTLSFLEPQKRGTQGFVVPIIVIIEKSRGGVSLMEQDTIKNVS